MASSSSRPKRTTRNQNPSYKFKTEEDFVKPRLIGERKHEILELLKRDLKSPSKAADVGSGKHLEQLAGKVGVPPQDLRKWLGITDDLTQVTGGSVSSKKKVEVSSRASSKIDSVEKLDTEVKRLRRQLNDFEEDLQKGNLPSDEALMELEKEIQQAAEQVDEAIKQLPTKRKGSALEVEEDIQQATDQVEETVKLLPTEGKGSSMEEEIQQGAEQTEETKNLSQTEVEGSSMEVDEEIQQATDQIDEAVKLLPTDEKGSLMEEAEEVQRATEQIKKAVKMLPTDEKGAFMEEEEEIQQATEQITVAVKLSFTEGEGSSMEESPVMVQSKPLGSDEDDQMEIDQSTGKAPAGKDHLYFERVQKIQACLNYGNKNSKVTPEGTQSVGTSKSEHDGDGDKSDGAVEEMQESPQKDQDEKSTDILVEMKGLGVYEKEEE